LGAYLAWRFLFAPAVPVTEEGAPLPGVGPIAFEPERLSPEEAEAARKLTILSSMPVIDYWINKNTGDIFYVDLSGNIFRNSLGQEEVVSSQNIQNIHSIKPSPDGLKAIVTLGYPFETVLTIFDTVNNNWQPLPAGTISAAWDPQSNNQLAYLKTNANGRSSISLLILSDKKTAEIIKLNQKGLDLEWVVPDLLYLKQKPSAEYDSSIWTLNIKRRAFAPLIKEEAGLDVLWSDDGQLGLKFSGNGFSNSLTLIDNENRALANLDAVTLPSSKCTFNQDKVYCAIPASIPPRTKLPDEYLKKQIFFADLFYTINLSSGRVDLLLDVVSTLISLDITIDADHLSLQNDRLLFMNRYDQRLYSLEL